MLNVAANDECYAVDVGRRSTSLYYHGRFGHVELKANAVWVQVLYYNTTEVDGTRQRTNTRET